MCCGEAGYWVARARRRDLLALIAEVAADYVADESADDARRRAASILWLATRGEQGAWRAKTDPGDFLAARVKRHDAVRVSADIAADFTGVWAGDGEIGR